MSFHWYCPPCDREIPGFPFTSLLGWLVSCAPCRLPEDHGGRAVPDLSGGNPALHFSQNRRLYPSTPPLAVIGVGIMLFLVILAYAGPLFPVNANAGGNITPAVTNAPAPTVMQSQAPVSLKVPVTTPVRTKTIVPRPDPTTPAPAYETGAVSRSYDYVLRGSPGTIVLTLYTGIYDRQRFGAKPTTCLRHSSDPSPCTQEEIRQYYIKYLNETAQKKGLDDLVSRIRSKSRNPDDQARIAISLVQNIPYDYSKLDAPSPNMSYPYGVLFLKKGVCSEKSLLLAYLLRELGYGVVLFEFKAENHMALGIMSPATYSFGNSGYAFVETTAPSIVTDADGDYVGVGKLSSVPGIMQISRGRSFSSVSEEYQDAQQFNQLIGMGSVLDQAHYSMWTALVQKYGMNVVTPTGQPNSSSSAYQANTATCDINLGYYCSAGANCCQKNNLCYSPCSRGVWEPRDCVCIV